MDPQAQHSRPPPPKTSPMRQSNRLVTPPRSLPKPSLTPPPTPPPPPTTHPDTSTTSHTRDRLEPRFCLPDSSTVNHYRDANAVGTSSSSTTMTQLQQPASTTSGTRVSNLHAETGRRPRTLPDAPSLPSLQPSGVNRLQSTIDQAASSNVDAPKGVPVRQPSTINHGEKEAITSKDGSSSSMTTTKRNPFAGATSQSLALAKSPTRSDLPLIIVVKGMCNSASSAVLPPRILELDRAALEDKVGAVIVQCLSLVSLTGSRKTGGERSDTSISNSLTPTGVASIVDNVVIDHASLEQRGNVFPDTAILADVCNPDELLFLSVIYSPKDLKETPSALHRSMRSPLPSNANEAEVSTGTDGNSQKLASLEQRLSAVESFVRTQSQDRQTSKTPERKGNEAEANSASRGLHNTTTGTHLAPSPYSEPDPPLVDISPILSGLDKKRRYGNGNTNMDIAKTQKGSAESLWLSPPSSASADPPSATSNSYTARAERLAFLALESRAARLQRLDELKAQISDKVELYQWMSERVDRGGDATTTATPCHGVAAEPATGPFRGASRSASRGFGDVDHENVQVDYDPILDIWRLRRVTI